MLKSQMKQKKICHALTLSIFFEETIPVSQRQLSVIKILYELSQHLTQLEATQHSRVEVQTRRTDHLIGGDE